MNCFSAAPKGTSYTYMIPGNPVPLMRPRYHHSGRIWDAQALLKEKAAEIIKLQHRNQPLLSGALHMEIVFYMPIPKGYSIKKKERIRGKPHTYRPDFSNMLKLVEDVCQDIVYKEDCIISSLCGSKVYSEMPRTEVTFSEIIYE